MCGASQFSIKEEIQSVHHTLSLCAPGGSYQPLLATYQIHRLLLVKLAQFNIHTTARICDLECQSHVTAWNLASSTTFASSSPGAIDDVWSVPHPDIEPQDDYKAIVNLLTDWAFEHRFMWHVPRAYAT